MLFEKSSHVGLSLRTSLLCELEALTGCSMTWKDRATPAGRSWWVLGMSGRPTDEIECSSWPTVTASEAHKQSGRRSDSDRVLTAEAEKCWPTPNTIDAKGGMNNHGRRFKQVIDVSQHWPTAGGNDWKGSCHPGQRRGQLDEKAEQLWPTPRTVTGGAETAKRKKELGRAKAGGGDLQAATEMDWPTSTVGNVTGGNATRIGGRSGEMLLPGISAGFPHDPTTSPDGDECSRLISALPPPRRLNVRFVEWLMGFPSGWGDAGASST